MLDDLKHIKEPVPQWLDEVLSIPRISRTVDSQGCLIHYLEWGDRSNPTLLFLHGRMSHAMCWAFIAPNLTDAYHCIAMDCSGMGNSEHRTRYTYQHRAGEVLAVLNAATHDSATDTALLVSHSYGAVVALNAHHLAPSRFTGLVACDPSIHHPDTWASQLPRKDGPVLDRPHRVYDSIDTLVDRFAFAPPQTCRYEVLREFIAVHSARQVQTGWQWKFDPWVYSPREEGHNDWWVAHTQAFAAAQLPKAIVYGPGQCFHRRRNRCCRMQCS